MSAQEYNDQKFALVYFIRPKKFDILDIACLTEWDKELFELFRDGDRTETCSKPDDEYVVIVQTAHEKKLLDETKTFCEAMKSKRLSLSEAQKYFRPVRGTRRQSLPSREVTI